MTKDTKLEPMGFTEVYYRSIINRCVIADALLTESIFPVFLFLDRVGEFAVVIDREKVPTSLHPTQIQHQNSMNEIYDWCMAHCGPYGFAPILTGHNDYLTTRKREDALIRGVIIESEEQAVLFKLTFDGFVV